MKQRKFLSVAELDVDYTQRIIQGYFSKFSPDQIGDLTRKGTFTKTIKDRGPRDTPMGVRSKIKMGFNHGEVIGLPILIKEDDTGAYFEGRVDEHELGDRILTRVKSGSLDSCSFEYREINSIPVNNDKSVRKILTEVKLYEIGPVDYPMHEDASITGLKSKKSIGEAADRLLSLLRVKTEDYSDITSLKYLLDELQDLYSETTVKAAVEAAIEEAPPAVKSQPTGQRILEELANFKLNNFKWEI